MSVRLVVFNLPCLPHQALLQEALALDQQEPAEEVCSCTCVRACMLACVCVCVSVCSLKCVAITRLWYIGHSLPSHPSLLPSPPLLPSPSLPCSPFLSSPPLPILSPTPIQSWMNPLAPGSASSSDTRSQSSVDYGTERVGQRHITCYWYISSLVLPCNTQLPKIRMSTYCLWCSFCCLPSAPLPKGHCALLIFPQDRSLQIW